MESRIRQVLKQTSMRRREVPHGPRGSGSRCDADAAGVHRTSRPEHGEVHARRKRRGIDGDETVMRGDIPALLSQLSAHEVVERHVHGARLRKCDREVRFGTCRLREMCSHGECRRPRRGIVGGGPEPKQHGSDRGDIEREAVLSRESVEVRVRGCGVLPVGHHIPDVPLTDATSRIAKSDVEPS